MERIILIGAGGHFKVVADIIKDQYDIIGVTDADPIKQDKDFYGIKVLGTDEILPDLLENGTVNAFITIGSVGDNTLRAELYLKAQILGFNMVNVISPQSIISDSVVIGRGNFVADGVIIHADSIIDNNVILNTGCIIEHDCKIKDHVHVSIGARIAGSVVIGESTYVGMGASIIQGIRIGKNCIIGAGAVVINDIQDNSVCVGVPAKVIKIK